MELKERRRWRRKKIQGRRKRLMYVHGQFLDSAPGRFPSFSSPSVSSCCSEVKRDEEQTEGWVNVIVFVIFSPSLSILHSPLLAFEFSLMTHSPPELLLYRSRRCVSGSRQCSPAENTPESWLAKMLFLSYWLIHGG